MKLKHFIVFFSAHIPHWDGVGRLLNDATTAAGRKETILDRIYEMLPPMGVMK